MKLVRHFMFRFILAGAVPFSQSLLAGTITIEKSNGETFELGVDDQDPFFDVLGKIHSYYNEEDPAFKASHSPALSPQGISFSNTQWNLIVAHAGVLAKAKKEEKNERDYKAGISKSEKEDIGYIIKTLAFDSLIGIGRKKSSLKRAGDRVDHVHPFYFLMTIFLDEELKAGVAAIRSASMWVRDGFYDGITGSLKEEASRKNLFAFVDDFADKLKVKSESIIPFLQKEDWKGFVNYLIDTIPRETNPNRYNM